MKRLVLAGSIWGTMAVSLVACLLVLMTLAWLIRQWEPATWVVWTVALGMLGVVVVCIWRWRRLPAERRFRFSLRGMLVGITLFALWLGVVGIDLLRWRRELAAVMDLFDRGVVVNDTDGRFDPLEPLKAVLQHRRQLADLEVLDFRGVTHAGLARVEELDRCPKLRYCSLNGSQISDADLRSLTHWTNLRTIVLDGRPKITDAGSAHLVELPRLDRLVLLDRRNGPIGVTDAGLKHVGRMKQLRILQIEIPVGDRGMEALHDLGNLEELYLAKETEVTENCVKHFPIALFNGMESVTQM